MRIYGIPLRRSYIDASQVSRLAILAHRHCIRSIPRRQATCRKLTSGRGKPRTQPNKQGFCIPGPYTGPGQEGDVIIMSALPRQICVTATLFVPTAAYALCTRGARLKTGWTVCHRLSPLASAVERHGSCCCQRGDRFDFEAPAV